ncbi:hypothetical protein J3R30DRAFT_3696531 [Lentinula aciculospora]|uniref:Uncharacterized protein n=1 Tax=Lentinula aciculospora TaxID=153920 RepID=A0A9W9AKY7_9AGAR|nr:hypothetical protein J3R30DRAFT_3696531 [Lentinula aciculospora]
MRNTLPLLSRPTDPPFHSSDIPSIRLVTATPSASGFSSEASTSLEFSWTSVPSVPSPLAPKVDAEPRKRLVPKKSKLSLLGGGSKDKQKDRGKDLSDVVRRVGGGSTSRRAGGFEIYVDPADPDIGEIVMVKKKKSRAGLDGLRWGSGGGALGEVTNVPSVSQPVTAITKVKAEEKEKWWTLGRGRKDSKEKEKEKVREKSETRLQPPRSKTPEPFKPIPETQSRARFNSLDSGMLLTSAPNSSLNSANYNSRNTSTPLLCDPQEALPREERHVPGTYSRSATPTFGGLLAPPTQFDSLEPSRGIQGNSNQNSIALRAMRSIARIGSWAQLKNGTGPGDEPFPKELEKKEKDKVKTKSKEKDDTKKKSKKDKSEKKEDKNKSQRIRNSTSSFEAGALTTSPDAKASLGKKKRSILGLGLPSTMRLPAVRSGSTASSIGVNNADNNRLSVDSAVAIAARMRSGSTMSTGSSLRPVSTTSSTSCVSSGSSAASVRWDEAGLETVKELRRKERETKRQSIEDAEADATRKKANRESRRSSEGRRRTPIADVFPDIQEGSPEHAVSVRTISGGAPLLTLEEATSDGHERASEDELSTPLKRARPRPLSEQLLGRKRPQGIHEEDGEGVISILSAATNDLAQLINHLDLEATPGATPGTPSPDASQWRRPAGFQSPEVNQDSPTKKTLRGTMSSISSLRPYAQSRGSLTAKPTNTQDLLDQQIAPWPVLNSYFPQSNVPAKGYSPTVTSKARRMHKRTMSPSGYLPEASPPPPLRPLRPAKSRNVASSNLLPLGPPPSMDLPPVQPFSPADVGRAPSSLTFGSRSSSRGGDTSISSLDDIQTRNSVFKATHGHGRNRSSLLSSQPGSGSQGSIPVEDFTTSRPLSVEARRQLGMKGTMGGSDVSAYAVDELDASDPDSDIPDELQVILANQSPRSSVHSVKGTTSFHAPNSPDAPQDVSSFVPDPESETESTGRDVVDLPVFHLIDVDDNHADLDDMMDVDEDDTKKSFDFTGELQKLNESGGSDRASFVEQLEKAFKTPAKIDLRYDFSGQDGLLQVDIPPLPTLPLMVATDSSSSTELSDSSACSQEVHGGSSQTTLSSVEEFPISRLLDSKEPTLLPGSDSISSSNSYDLPDAFVPKILRSSSSSASHPSDGELNRSFKFGGFFKSPSQEIEPKKLISLSDIIPSPSRVRAMSNASSSVDDSVINSIIAKASEVPAVRPRLNSGSRTKRNAGDDSINAITRNIAYRHSRHESTNSFNGFDSFEEVRRGFEFHDYRPSFYPPPVSNSSRSRQNNHSKQESMMSFASISSYGHVVNPGIPDPFDYGLPSLQERPSSEDMTSTSFSMSIDDTFSFLKHAPPRKRVESDASSFYFNASGPSGRGHRRRESNMSVISQGPPISLYNRSFGHRRNDSSTSVSSMAHSYALHGTSGGRAAWAHHRQDASVDSMDSQFSAMHLGRPGIGDKMFDTAANFGAPLTSISASPPGSMYSQSRSSFDSIMDDHPRTSLEDSLFDKTGQRMSVSSESVFGYDNSSRYSKEHLLPQNAFRPVSYLSINSVHSPTQEDDTMISMIGGGHVRRRSVGSVIETSPCVRAVGHLGKRKHAPLVKEDNDEGHARIVEKASIVSTSSSKFGGERMIRATKGLLERQSLEESCLIAEGEDLSTSYSIPVFTRPNSASRSRSSTCTSSSSGVDTPPLSASDGSSTSGGSQSSIDLAQLHRILANATHPISNIALQRDRARARGEGHRRRISQARMSRSSVYETIEEEMYSPGDTPLSQSTTSRKSSPTAIQPVFIVDPADNASIHSMDSWDDERGIVAMRRYYELRSEAEYTVSESRRLWVDTPFSIYALQNFDPPRHPSGMQALLASSVESYGPLPTDLRPRRRRTSSRPSPYPQGRSVRVSLSPDYPRPTIVKETSPRLYHANQSPPLKEVTAHPNITSNSPAPLSLTNKQVFSRATNSPEKIMQKRENVRPRVPSTTRRTALGWSKRSAKASSELKENQNNNSFGQGVGMTPGNNSLRLSRPRPRGRPTPVRPALRI